MKRSLMGLFGLLAFIGALWLGWTFRAGNAGRADLDLILTRVPDVELWRAMLAAAGAGALLASIVVGFAWLRLRLLLRRYRARTRRLEKEVHELRSLPLHTRDSGSVESPSSNERMAASDSKTGSR